jgi:hypothetical protein
MKLFLQRLIVVLCVIGFNDGFTQSIGDIIVISGQVNPEETIGNFEKIADKPKIEDTIKKIVPGNYVITSKAVATEYAPSVITAVRMKNEPLSKLYHCLIKAGYGNYNTPYGEIFLTNLRSRENALSLRYRHFSSNWDLENRGFSGYSDNDVLLGGKHFFKKHTLSGELNYFRNAVHFYGYSPSEFAIDSKDSTRQVFNTFEIKSNFKSHYQDTTKLNYEVNLNAYNLQDKFKTNEFYIGTNGIFKSVIKGEKFNVVASTDYFQLKTLHDTINNAIIKLNPYFEAGGKKWNANLGLVAVLDQFSDSSSKFNFYPRLTIEYDIYKQILIPYGGIGGDLQKNSHRSLVQRNPFLNSSVVMKNTSTNLEFFGGLKGALTSKINYIASVSFSNVTDFALYRIDYFSLLQNRFRVDYTDGNVLKLGGQLKYSDKEKLNINVQAYYYQYQFKDIEYAWHQPNFEGRLNASYNLQSKIILKADLYFIGTQWALTQKFDSGSVVVSTPVKIKGITDVNLGAEYRYSKFLSAFVQFNNIGGVRYFRWDQYPTQRFNFMIGLSFIPF